MVCDTPMVTIFQSLSVPMRSGVTLAPAPSSPSWLLEFEPQPHSEPSVLMKKAYAFPPTAFFQSASCPTIWHSAVRSATPGTPSWPFSFHPQLHSVPSSRMA